MSDQTKISLRAARVNAGMTQPQAAVAMSEYLGAKTSRQRIAYFEANPDKIPMAWAIGFSRIYNIPLHDLSFFTHNLTLSKGKINREESK